MPTPNYKNLLRLYEAKSDEAPQIVRGMFEEKAVRPSDFDLGRLFEECFGWNNFRWCREDKANLANSVMEAAGGVSTAAFTNISGQIVFAETLEKYEDEDFVFTKLIPERQSKYTFEKIAGVTRIGDEIGSQVVGESEPFPIAGVGQNWIHGPETQKRGEIIPVTREAIFFDRTGQLLERCGEVGYWYGVNREKRAIDCVIDENGGAKSAALGGHRYHWRDTSISTYNDNTGSHSWDNLVATNALVDWTDVDGAEQALNEIVDPDTSEPVVIEAKHLVVVKALQKVAERIVHGTWIRVATPGYATSANPTQTQADNPYQGKLSVVTSRLLAARLATDTSWFYGDIAKAFFCAINFPFDTRQAPANSYDEFHRDIVQQYRADGRENYGTKNPRYMIKSTA